MSLGNPDKKKKQGYDPDWKWEQGDLKDINNALKEGAKWDKEHSKSGWTNKEGTKFSAEHYKENYDNDKKAIKRIQNEIKKRRLSKSLKEKANRVSKDTKFKKRDSIDDYIEQ